MRTQHPVLGRVSLAIREAPTASAQPTILFRQVIAPVKTRHVVRPALFESSGESGLGFRVAHPFTGKDRYGGNAPGKKIAASLLDAKHRAPLYITTWEFACG
jgi:hypothetical protein